MKKVNYILAVLILLTFLVTSPADVVKGVNGVEVPPDCGVVFDQVDFTFPALSVLSHDSGAALPYTLMSWLNALE